MQVNYLKRKKSFQGKHPERIYYSTDPLGSTILVSDSDGEVVWSGDMMPFGEQESTIGLSEHVLYAGKELDEDTRLYYFNARWYDPELGRFTTEDPARDGLNWYVYVNNNPLGFVDPSGYIGQQEVGRDSLSEINLPLQSEGPQWIKKSIPIQFYPTGSELNPFSSRF